MPSASTSPSPDLDTELRTRLETLSGHLRDVVAAHDGMFKRADIVGTGTAHWTGGTGHDPEARGEARAVIRRYLTQPCSAHAQLRREESLEAVSTEGGRAMREIAALLAARVPALGGKMRLGFEVQKSKSSSTLKIRPALNEIQIGGFVTPATVSRKLAGLAANLAATDPAGATPRRFRVGEAALFGAASPEAALMIALVLRDPTTPPDSHRLRTLGMGLQVAEVFSPDTLSRAASRFLPQTG